MGGDKEGRETRIVGDPSVKVLKQSVVEAKTIYRFGRDFSGSLVGL